LQKKHSVITVVFKLSYASVRGQWFPFSTFQKYLKRHLHFSIAPGKDLTISSWNIGDLLSTATPKEKIARFLVMTEYHPSVLHANLAVDWSMFFDDNLEKLLSIFPRTESKVEEMVKSTNPKIYSTLPDKTILKILREKQKKAMPDDLKAKALEAEKKLMNFEWTKVRTNIINRIHFRLYFFQ
jgi:hypothetical protein